MHYNATMQKIGKIKGDAQNVELRLTSNQRILLIDEQKPLLQQRLFLATSCNETITNSQ